MALCQVEGPIRREVEVAQARWNTGEPSGPAHPGSHTNLRPPVPAGTAPVLGDEERVLLSRYPLGALLARPLSWCVWLQSGCRTWVHRFPPCTEGR